MIERRHLIEMLHFNVVKLGDSLPLDLLRQALLDALPCFVRQQGASHFENDRLRL